jgi:hypothetical protein
MPSDAYAQATMPKEKDSELLPYVMQIELQFFTAKI